VVNGVIAADFVSPTGLRPVTINISGFAPEELLQLLPPQPDTPALQASVCLALLKANRKSEIAAHVPSCGVLGPVLEAAAAAKAEAF